MVFSVEPENDVAQAERRLRGQRALRRGVHAVAEEENGIWLDEHQARVRAVVAADVVYVDGHTAEIDLDPIVEDDVGGNNLDRTRRGQLRLDGLDMLQGREAGGKAPLEPVVAPVSFRQLHQPPCGQCMGDHESAYLRAAENVVPMGVRVDDGVWPHTVLGQETDEERARVCGRRPGVQHERVSIAHDCAQRGPVGRTGRHPIDVLSDLRQHVHRGTEVSPDRLFGPATNRNRPPPAPDRGTFPNAGAGYACVASVLASLSCTLRSIEPMERRPVGGSGVEISRIGLGGYELGPEPGDAPDVDRAVSVIELARAVGVNWLDTSENYLETRNEAVLGQALDRIGDDFLVASKVAPGSGVTGGGSGFRREQVLQACRDSLKRLRRDHLDIYFLHWPDGTGVPLDETWGAMAQLADAGLVRAIGMSNYNLGDVERCHAQRPVDAVQVGLNLIDYLDDRPSIAAFGKLGIAVTIFEPLASGVLSGKTLTQVRDAWGELWVNDAFYKRTLNDEAAQRLEAIADGLRAIADKLAITPAQVAIAWVLQQPGVTAAIAGSRDGRHMQENAGAAALDLSEVLPEIEQLILLRPSSLRSLLQAETE
jgi:aryl-alcohol dehydrogenase-like predicted oxidoreductase